MLHDCVGGGLRDEKSHPPRGGGGGGGLDGPLPGHAEEGK